MKATQPNFSNTFEETNQLYRKFFENLPTPAHACDAEGFVRVYNQAAVNLWGREPKIGRDKWCGSWRIYSLNGFPIGLDECPLAISIKENKAVLGEEIIIERPDGTRLHVLPHPILIKDSEGTVIGAVNTLMNLTDQKIIERRLQGENERMLQEVEERVAIEVEKRVRQRTQELKLSNDELARINTQLSSFNYLASHDLKEPLRQIQMFESIIIKNDEANLSNVSKDYLRRSQNVSQRMQTLIDDLLAYSRLDTSEIKFENVKITSCLQKVLQELKETIDEKKAIIEFDVLPAMKIIPYQFRQLFTNLIRNSLKFSRKGVLPHITIRSEKVKGETIKEHKATHGKEYNKFTITDNGIGFHPKFNELIFQVFQRLHEKDKYPGSGIGLAICKKIVENHAGFIHASGDPDRGATFTFFV